VLLLVKAWLSTGERDRREGKKGAPRLFSNLPFERKGAAGCWRETTGLGPWGERKKGDRLLSIPLRGAVVGRERKGERHGPVPTKGG